jgi:hypothetical protein
MKRVFVLLFISVVFSKVMAQTIIVRKGTMKVRKAQAKPMSEQRILNMETDGSDRTAKDRQQRERIDMVRKRKIETDNMKADSLRKLNGK